MMAAAFQVVGHALMITGFVLIMMLVIEYLNVLSRGRWDRMISRWKWGQSAFAALLGASPGCLGAYAVGSLYMHRVLTLGALVAAMIATSGDEAFVMLALFPRQALLLFAILWAVGVASGLLTDLALGAHRTRDNRHLKAYMPAHAAAECIPFSAREARRQWQHCSPHRGWLTAFLLLFLAGVLAGVIGHQHPAAAHGTAGHATHAVEAGEAHAHDTAHAAGPEAAPAHAGHDHADWNWVRVTLLVLGILATLIVATVPDHFLDEHLWNHLVRVHAGRIFLWTFIALEAAHLLQRWIDVAAIVDSHRLPILLVACLTGIIPESGPHLIFTTLYASGAIPFSVLLASSIVQDGHGMIPILAHSPRAFALVKVINFAVGLAAGLLGYAGGW